MTRIFLDDIRKAPDRSWITVRTYDQCTRILSHVKHIDVISLDYDLHELKTGYDVLVYMHEHDIVPDEILIHSTHYFGKERMMEYVRTYFPTM